MSGVAASSARRLRVRVEGVVQGVGFRPHVYRLASELGLAGFVLNDELGVLLEIEGEPAALERFLARLAAGAPPLARIERVHPEHIPPIGDVGFQIVASRRLGAGSTPISPDMATCAECLAELFDPADRRFRYPFINCTNCGPRFTIVRGVPYDRPLTAMAGFAMCAQCAAEYHDPASRRFHAQPNACPECGPRARLVDRDGLDMAPAGDPVHVAATSIMAGSIVAVKGIGGFHLACRADHEAAVAALRSRKHREEKPFALMVPDLDSARALVRLGAEEETLLESRARPIVLCACRGDAPVAPSVAPRLRELGVMLPYTPLHFLLLADVGVPLVMTSGNVSDEPIAYHDEDARRRLGGIADLLLVHDRPIETRTDDSVVRTTSTPDGHRAVVLRRSRGHVPGSLALPAETRPLLACGAELKSTFCLARGRDAWLGHHIGDLKNLETLESFREGVALFERLFAVEPEVVAHDLHPDYLSTRYALERDGSRRVAVQHHHAHLAACLAEHGEIGKAIGAIYDGAGYGPDGTIWGGELLFGGVAGFERVGHLRPVRLPGGDRAAREPWRMACAWLAVVLGREPDVPFALRGCVDSRQWHAMAELARTGVASPVTTSMGRLFDAAAALIGVRGITSYEGQAAIELEAIADGHETARYSLGVGEAADGIVVDPGEMILALARDAAAGVAPGVMAARVHNAIAGATTEAVARLAESCGTQLAVLSGGVFQNRRLLERTRECLSAAGLRVLTPERVPPNDAGIAYGQAA
ncbi:MAG: carbamoyltransferase HypF, partial [Gemmatimonadales bacterium]